MFKNLQLTLFALGVCLFAQVVGADSLDAGLLYDDFNLTLAPGHRTEIAGPAFYFEEKETQKQWALPPLWSDTRDSATDSEEMDFLYPLLTWDRFGTEYRFQIIQLFSFTGGQNQKENLQRRFTLFPIYFQQRSPDPALNYTALFPIYGHLIGRPLNMRDDIRFVLFPFYSKTRKRDVITDNYLFPLFHLRHGDGLQGWQVWPLIGHEQKTLTYKTNLFDTVEAVVGHDKWFALWPIFFDNNLGLGTTNLSSEFAILPAYDQFRSPLRDSTSVLWPFFNFIDDREKKYHEWEVPYPFIVFARGEGKTTSRVWPFFGRSHNAIQSSDFYAWPIYQNRHLVSDPLDRSRLRIFFFLYSDVIQNNTETGKHLRRVDFCPFFTWHRDYNGDQWLQILAPIEPFLPNNKSVERNWSPLWSLWRSAHTGSNTVASQSLLWNLYRHDRAADGEKFSLLFGLFRYKSGVDGRQWRLFYIPLGKSGAARTNAATEIAPQFQNIPATPAQPSGPRIEHPLYDAVPTNK